MLGGARAAFIRTFLRGAARFLAGSSVNHLCDLLLLRRRELCAQDRRQSRYCLVSWIFGRLTVQTLRLADLFRERALRDVRVSGIH